jgi:hypothetical protein
VGGLHLAGFQLCSQSPNCAAILVFDSDRAANKGNRMGRPRLGCGTADGGGAHVYAALLVLVASMVGLLANEHQGARTRQSA